MAVSLSAEIAEKLVNASRIAAKKSNVIAVAVYGSRISGYARQDSDYDLLVIVDKQRPKAKYVYGEHEGTYYSALLVQKDSFEKDCSQASLGEFAAGRILNRYEEILGQGYFSLEERILKRRIIIEEIQEIVEKYGPFSAYITVRPEYFLFSKLKKRGMIYPPVVYSYIRTYSPPVREENLSLAVRIFREELEKLCDQGLLEKDGDGFKLTKHTEEKLKTRPFLPIIRIARRGIKQYLVHGLAGNVGFDVAFRELFSKISRRKLQLTVPRELKEPRQLLSIPEGKLAFDTDWLEEILSFLSIERPYKVFKRQMGDFFSTVTTLTISKDSKQFRMVSKKYKDIWSVKWVVANIAAISAKSFEFRPMHRLAMEYNGILSLRRLGLRTPTVYGLQLDDRIMVREHMDGVTLEELMKRDGIMSEKVMFYLHQFASLLAKVHNSGMSIGDTKPSNILCMNNDITLIDLEQFKEGGDKAWDIAEFVYYCCIGVHEERIASAFAREFARAYSYEGSRSILETTQEQKYLMPFQVLVLPNVLRAARDSLVSL